MDLWIEFPDGSRLGVWTDPEKDFSDSNRYALVRSTPKGNDQYNTKIYFRFDDIKIGANFINDLYDLLISGTPMLS